ncbi:hypothetical protein ACO0KY_15055 [Undibacterium sp. Dicai25W]|uniref:hypothetical protein n=1 Tax=Undibacterium sp. Dicai25W TaxID=3413034 RepID=UPI003BF4116C
MAIITDFTKIRLDGKIIDERHELRQPMNSGWAQCIVTEWHWRSTDQIVTIKYAGGVLAKLLPRNTTVRIIDTVIKNGIERSALSVLDSHRELKYSIPNVHSIKGNIYQDLLLV